jgi:ribosomal protein S18 acetylase RimI-like enzyme
MLAYRGQRIALRLLESLEQHLRRAGVTRLRIASLATNTAARATYERGGFVPYEIIYEKPTATRREEALHIFLWGIHTALIDLLADVRLYGPS